MTIRLLSCSNQPSSRLNWLPLLLAAALVGCGAPSESTGAAASKPTVPPASAPAHDSVRATLTTPAPDGTATGTVDTAAPPATLPKPVPGARPTEPAPTSKPQTRLAPPAALGVAAVAAPAKRIQAGRVLDEAGQPLVGATVMLKGTATGTSTDGDGHYMLDVPAGENTFVIGYGGYEDETATTRTSQPLTVTLLPRAGRTTEAQRQTARGR